MSPSTMHAIHLSNIQGSHEGAVLHLNYLRDPLSIRALHDPNQLYQLLQALLGDSYFAHAKRLIGAKAVLSPEAETVMGGDVNRLLAVALLRMAGTHKLLREIYLRRATDYIYRAIHIHTKLGDDERLALDLVVVARISILQGSLSDACDVIDDAMTKIIGVQPANSASARHVGYWALLVTTMARLQVSRELAYSVIEEDLDPKHGRIAQRLDRSMRPERLAQRVVHQENSVPLWQRARENTQKPAWGWLDVVSQT